MDKEFIPYDTVRNNALKLAARIYTSGFIPDVIYVSLRGGAYMGNVISEFFKRVNTGDHPVFYAAVVAHSYSDIRKNSQVRIDGWTYSPDHLRSGDKILFIDDIFDTGKTVNFLVDVLLQRGLPRKDIKVAVHDYKVYLGRDELPIQPDFYCRKLVIENLSQDRWIHYMSHELVGLTKAEQEKYYISRDPELQTVFELLNS
ncbi:MAG: phosphoribosyl transferase [Spirochaetes bacterium GWB1_48_6]|nr:MAG: phosphoribosyl transferase [Spirochaetes bacterium GWB1_48_6]